MKKIILLIVCLLLSWSLFACNNSNNNNNGAKDNPVVTYGTVILKDDINNKYDTLNLEVGKKNTLPTPSNADYKFIGWYLDEEFFNGPYVEITVQSGTVTYFAKWEVKEEVIEGWGTLLKDEIDLFLNSSDKELAIAKAYLEKYEKLYSASKPYVTNIEDLKSYISAEEKNLLIADCIDRINKLGAVTDLTLADKEKVNSVIEYISSNIDASDLSLITNYDTLDQMNERFKVLETVKELVDAIDALPNPVTVDDEATVKAIYTKYTQIKIVNRTLVTNAQTLLDAKTRIDNLKKVTGVIERIANLPEEVTLKDRAEIYYCNSDYEKLTTDQKALVTNYEKLVAAKNAIDELIGNGETIAKEFDAKISLLPSTITYDFSEEVKALKAEYDEYPEQVTTCLKFEDKLINAYNTIVAIENDVNNVTYCLGKYNYFSRDDFYRAFVGEFYDYLVSYHGERVANRVVDNKNEFLALGKNWDADNGEMRGLGNAYGSYFTAKDTNGIVQNQPLSCYFGYCYQNNKYMDFFDFFFRFFAYWRIDEGYAKKNNYGADTYAEAWAPCVDFCKFFYFEVDTCYVKTERMQDCYNNCANVVYGDFTNGNGAPPTDIRLRGYDFAGWYDNPNFTGSPVTSVAPGGKKVILYAKWVRNDAQYDADKAALVDVYLYNITCTPAKKNVTTVNYIFNMYEELSSNGKSLVTETVTLEQLYNEFAEALENPITIKFTTNIPAKSFDELKTEFLNDYNNMFSTSITDYSQFTSNQYTHMKNLLKFFANKKMYTKWGFIPTTIVDMNLGNGLGIQSTRVLNGQSGDLEYLSCAIDGLFSKKDLSADSTIKIDFSSEDIISLFVNNQNTFKLTYSTKANLPDLSYNGLTFKGFFNNDVQYTKVTADTPLELTAIFE